MTKLLLKESSEPEVQPIYFNGKYHDDAKDKADILNIFFHNQSMVDDSNCSLPDDDLNMDPNHLLSDINITIDDVKDALKILDSNKDVGPDLIHGRILKECQEQLAKPLCQLFKKSLSLKKFPSDWKLANVIPIYKKDDRADPKNYRPISLLSILGKVFERIVFKYVHNFFLENQFIISAQSGFTAGDSTTNQLIDIYNSFCKALDEGKEIRAVFCDISKAFDKVWHRGLIYKLQKAGISGSLLAWFENYLSHRKQRVVISGQCSEFIDVQAGVPQGSILGPLLFLVYINDIIKDVQSNIKLFADDTSLSLIVSDPFETANIINNDLDRIHKWAETWLVKFNPSKTVSLLISRKTQQQFHPLLQMNNIPIKEVESHKHLGVIFNNKGTWSEHIKDIGTKAWKRLNIMRKFKFILDRSSLQKIYFTFIRPLLEYSNIVWDNCTLQETEELEKIQLEAARIVTGTTKLVSLRELYKETGWEKLEVRRKKHKLTKFYSIITGQSPDYLQEHIPQLVSQTSDHNLRNSNDFRTIQCRTALYENSFFPATIKDWNALFCR